MMLPWLVYAVVVSGLIGVAAWLAERGAWAQRWPSRWVWAGAMVASVMGPWVAWLAPRPSDPAVTPLVGVPGAYVLESLPLLAVGPAAQAGPSLDALIVGAWAVASLLLLAVLAGMAIRLERRRRRWPRQLLDGIDVLVSDRTGPAAIGWLRGHVVVPKWTLSLEPGQRRLLLAHEAEHVQAGDPQLSLAGLVVCALVPWNLPLWWQLRRLRLAIEVDCDARVLLRHGDADAYGSLLLAVGRRRSHLAVALVESRNMLERRIRMITRKTRTRTTTRALGLALGSALVLAVACETPGPTGTGEVEPRSLEIGVTQAAVETMECDPAVYVNATRSTLGAVERDNVETIHVFKGPGADESTDDGEACGVIVVMTKDADVEETDAARRLVERLSQDREGRSGGEAGRSVTLESVQDEPTFTPMTVRPQLRNAAEVMDALQRYYPSQLEDAGIGGTVKVWFLIDREGVVQRTRIADPSEHEALDAAALAVADQMRFTPAYNRDERVPVWVALPITFQPDASVSETTAPRPRPEPSQAPTALAREPRFTPMTERPQLRNPQEILRLLQRSYPPALRDTGIGGVAHVWFFIDETGQVAKVQIHESSGHPALDEAALAVGRQMEFEPALNGDEPVAVWVSLPVMFEVQ